jgi:membrane protein implicated in regulation of membrane protease activity
MKSSSADFSTILNRILDTAADNLRIAKILVQMGLDPSNITYDALFNRLLEIMLANITLANMFAVVGVIFFVATLLMQTMVPLRVANMIGCAFFALFGALTGAITTFLLYLLMVPINAYRLRPNAGSREEGPQRDEGRYIAGMAQAVHDRAQISQG